LPALRDAVSVVVAAGATATTEDCDGARMLEERADGPGPPHLRIAIVFAIRLCGIEYKIPRFPFSIFQKMIGRTQSLLYSKPTSRNTRWGMGPGGARSQDLQAKLRIQKHVAWY